MNIFELIKEKLEEYQENNTQNKSSDDYELGLFNACDYAIDVIDEVEKEFEEKYLIVPKDDFTEYLINMGYNKGSKDAYNKAIDEFANKMKWEYDNSTGVRKKEIDFAKAVIDMVAEQLKGGSDDE